MRTKEEIKAYRKAYLKAYRLLNKDKRRLYFKAWKLANPEKMKALHKAWILANPEKSEAWKLAYKEKRKAINKAWDLANKDRKKVTKRDWDLANKDKRKDYQRFWGLVNPAKRSAISAKRRATKLLATPSWLTKDDIKKIESFYILAKNLTLSTGIRHDVDHIVPLRGKNVSGLHVPWNLQVLTSYENGSKGNKY